LSVISVIEGTISALNTAYGSTSALGNGISGLGNETVTIDDTASIDASALNTLNGYTTGNIVATTATSFTGTISDLNTLYAAAASSGNGVTGVAIQGI
jgi:glutamate/tyrosine decarboxylase-like PLP-dependent enzyme